MKKFLIILICLITLTGCNTKNKISYEITLDEFDDNYEWVYTVADDSILKVTNDDNEFKIISLIPGSVTVYFDYAKKSDKEDVLYNYQIELEVTTTLDVNKKFESGSYMSLKKFMKLGKEKLGLSGNFNEYKFIFSDDVVNVNEDECDWLAVYNKNNDIVASYAISRANDNIYKNVNGDRVLIN